MRILICSLAIISLFATPTLAADTHVDQRGVFFVDGQPRVPLAVWMQPAYLFDFNKALGVECIFHPSLDNREGNLFYDTKNVYELVNKYNFSAIEHQRQSLIDEPAIWGWMNSYLAYDRPEHVASAYKNIRSRDNTRAVFNNISIFEFLNPANAEGYRQALKHTDAIICHVFPEQQVREKPNIRNVVIFIKQLREYCKDRPEGEVSIWVDINPHEWAVKEKYGGRYIPAPTRTEFRFQFWVSLIHGADAICLFPISFDPFVFNQTPAKLMQEFAWNARLLKRMEPVLTSKESPLNIKITGDSPAAIVDYTTRQLGNDHYIILTNGEDREQKITLAITGLSTKWQLHDAINNKTITTNKNTYTESLTGLALRIWKLTDTNKKE